MMRLKSRLSATEKQRQRLLELKTICQEVANSELQGAARRNNVEFAANNTITGVDGVISSFCIPGLHVYFRLELNRDRAELRRTTLAAAGLINHVEDPLPWAVSWACHEQAKTDAAIAIISPTKHDWPPEPELAS